MTTTHTLDTNRLPQTACAFVELGITPIIPGDICRCNGIEFKVVGIHKRCLQDVLVSYVPLCGYESKQEFRDDFDGVDFGKVCSIVFVVKV